MILGRGESEEAAEARMREIWSRELAWTGEETEKIVYGDAESNSLVRSVSQPFASAAQGSTADRFASTS
jgi:hypothetical protein